MAYNWLGLLHNNIFFFMQSWVCPVLSSGLVYLSSSQTGLGVGLEGGDAAQVGTTLVCELASLARCWKPSGDDSHSPDTLSQPFLLNGPACGSEVAEFPEV